MRTLKNGDKIQIRWNDYHGRQGRYGGILRGEELQNIWVVLYDVTYTGETWSADFDDPRVNPASDRWSLNSTWLIPTWDTTVDDSIVAASTQCTHPNKRQSFIGPMIGMITYCPDCKQEIS
jgi:hypothetical protein